jgi:S-adenosylmethionine synthetase
MPLPVSFAHALASRLEQVVRNGSLPYLLPDGKSQVAVEFLDRRPVRLAGVTLTACQQRYEAVTERRLRDDLIQAVIEPELARLPEGMGAEPEIYVNPEGPFVGGGPAIHSGLTGRKTGIDAYGEYARHSGAALSGKDPLRIDRVGAYAARYAAKHVVAAGLAEDCELQLSFAIGQPGPISMHVDSFNTGTISDDEIGRRLAVVFDLRPAGIVRSLQLQRLPVRRGGFYRRLAAYGQMGREDLDAPWEQLDRLDALTS